MKTEIPSPEQLRAKLLALGAAEMRQLADATHVPFHTLVKIRNGETSNPRLQTVRALWPALDLADAASTGG